MADKATHLIPLVNNLLDRVRLERGLSSDDKLAKALGVSDTTIYRWRTGTLDKSARVLLPLVIGYTQPLDNTPQT